jgi:RNA polymerase sigma-70 factor (ECF subfamily)
MERTDSPVVALNRAVAMAKVHGPQAGLDAIGAIRDREPLESYYLYYSVLAEFEAEVEDYALAAQHLRQALKFTEVTSERTFLSKRLAECEAHLS